VITGLASGYPSTVYLPATIDGLPVTGISNYAFENYTDLKIVYINPAIAALGKGAFKGSSIEQVIFQENSIITSILAETFKNTSKLTSVTFEGTSSIARIEAQAFENSGITSINLPSSLTYIGTYASKILHLQRSLRQTCRPLRRTLSGVVSFLV
jgi:hypothetical protein